MEVQKVLHQLAGFKGYLLDMAAKGSSAEQRVENKRADSASSSRESASGDEKKADSAGKAKEIAEEIKEFLKAHDRRLQFYVHEGTERIAVKIVDDRTQEVIREVPLEELLDLAAKIKNFAGLLLDERG